VRYSARKTTDADVEARNGASLQQLYLQSSCAEVVKEWLFSGRLTFTFWSPVGLLFVLVLQWFRHPLIVGCVSHDALSHVVYRFHKVMTVSYVASNFLRLNSSRKGVRGLTGKVGRTFVWHRPSFREGLRHEPGSAHGRLAQTQRKISDAAFEM
jgi:hypothetical protein